MNNNQSNLKPAFSNLLFFNERILTNLSFSSYILSIYSISFCKDENSSSSSSSSSDKFIKHFISNSFLFFSCIIFFAFSRSIVTFTKSISSLLVVFQICQTTCFQIQIILNQSGVISFYYIYFSSRFLSSRYSDNFYSSCHLNTLIQVFISLQNEPKGPQSSLKAPNKFVLNTLLPIEYIIA